MIWHVFGRRTLRGRRYFFHLRASNGKIVLQSEGYRNRADAMRTLELVKREGGQARVTAEPLL